jgi:hypothetical protein
VECYGGWACGAIVVPVCAFSYAARIGNSHIDLYSFSDADPAQWELYDS